jgi:site-specific DNA-methyltransferase (adenine-specific)
MDLDPTDAKLLALADNKVGEIATWSDGLGDLLKSLEADGIDLDGLGFDDDELGELLAPLPIEPDGSEDEVPDLQEEAHSQTGEVYELGPHRLACGDCTDPAVWDAVVGDERLRCVWTDPPYGVSVNAVKSVDEAKALNRRTDGLMVSNDAMTPEDTAGLWSDAFAQLQRVSEPGAAWYACSADRPDLWGAVVPVMIQAGWKRMLIWVKDRFVMGRGDYHYRHEPIFHGWFGGAARLHPVPRTVDTVLECKRPGASKEHPTMKPVDLIRPMIENSSGPGWMVGDPFGGSGSTLIACAMTGRVARLIELDPRYCDVIRRRWTTWAKQHGQDPGPGALE